MFLRRRAAKRSSRKAAKTEEGPWLQGYVEKARMKRPEEVSWIFFQQDFLCDF